MLTVGLTGSLASGKTKIADMFRRWGAAVLDADNIAHRAIYKNSGCFKKIIKVFGRGILNPGGSINRAKLAEAAFAAKTRQRQLNCLVHPWVLKTLRQKIKVLKKRRKIKVLLIEAALLIESGFHREVDVIIVTKAPLGIQIKRALKRADMSLMQIKKRIKLQLSINKKIKIADYVIDNGTTLINTQKQARKIWDKLIKKS